MQFVVVAAGSSAGTIPITPSSPSATGINIVVADLSTAGSSAPASDVNLNVVAIGPFRQRQIPARSGRARRASRGPRRTATEDLCAFSVSGLAPSFSTDATGPNPADVPSLRNSPGFGIVQLTLRVPSTAVPGARTLFIEIPRWMSPQPPALWRFNDDFSEECCTRYPHGSWQRGLMRDALEQMDLAQLAHAAAGRGSSSVHGSVSQPGFRPHLDVPRFSVVEAIQGSPDATLIVRLPGGREGHVMENVEGVPRFSPGEETILFLERARPPGQAGGDEWSVTAWGEGTFRIERDARYTGESVTQDSSRMPVFDRATRTFRAQGIARMPMPDFLARLAAARKRKHSNEITTKPRLGPHGWHVCRRTACGAPRRANHGRSLLAELPGSGHAPASIDFGRDSCPQPTRFDTSVAGGINRLWSTSLSTSPATILTADQTPSGQLAEIENTIQTDFGIWTGESGRTPRPASLAPLDRTSAQIACNSTDGLNTICFNQPDAAFTTGVLSFTRVVTADVIGEQAGPGTPLSTFRRNPRRGYLVAARR